MVHEYNYAGESSQSSSSAVTDRTPLLQASHNTMVEKNIGISQHTLVSNGEQEAPARKLPQYLAAFAATLGAFAAGMVLAWTSPAGFGGLNLAHEYNINISISEFSWIGALANVGAAVICVPIGIFTDLIGRKNSMLMLVVPFTVGWALIIWSNSVVMFYVGRFITGLSGGAFCVTAPMYTAEIAEKEIRGRLGSYFQLLLTAGILLTYILGAFINMFWLSVISAIVPLIFFCVFFFMPETPAYYLKKGNTDAARASLIRLRGHEYNYELELQTQQESLVEANRNRVPFLTAIKSKAGTKALIIGVGLMLFQQLSGVNAIIFYAASIFDQVGSSMSSEVSTIIVGVIQTVAVFVSSLFVDKLGRRIPLLLSGACMAITTLILGIYFHLKLNDNDVSSIAWLPLLCVCIFIIAFSIGYGPIPWMMIGEIFTAQTKGIAGSSACLVSWLMAFIVTKFYSDLEQSLGINVTFWIFAGISTIGIIFVFFLVPETKGKSLEQIQIELGADPPSNQSSDKP